MKQIDPGAMTFANRIADIVRDWPVIDFANPNYKIEQIVLKDITDDVNFMQVPKVDRCITCHKGIMDPDYKDALQPFTTHPDLELYAAKNSSHPVEAFGCTTCHNGRGRGTDFVSAAHTPSSALQKKEWEEKYHWHKYHHWKTPMYPAPYVEAGCLKCHSNETSIKGAQELNLGLNLIEKAGCYGCHTIKRYKDWPRPGPDLTHLSAKVSTEWAYRWIENPRSFRHNAWMPSFFNQSNNNDTESVARAQQEIHAMVHYLFKESEGFELVDMPQEGNPKNGQKLVASVGCLGCHNVQPNTSTDTRTRDSLKREQGPNLIALGSKTSKKWIYNWLKDPHRYHPATRMPNLRLTDKEAADITAYLMQDKNVSFSEKVVPGINEKLLNGIMESFLQKSLTQDQAQEKIAQMSLDDKLHYSGEKFIAHYGCYACHNIKGFEKHKPVGTELTEEGSKAVERFDFGLIPVEHKPLAFFTQKLKNPRVFDRDRIRAPDEKLKMPNFHFSDEEVHAIVTALLSFVKDKPDPSIMKARTTRNLYTEEGQKIVRQFNCQGCHIIEGEGGAIQPEVINGLIQYDQRSPKEAAALVKSFSPPDLIGEGQKVQAKWLFEFLHEPVTIRPWLKIRMPTYRFKPARLNTLVKYFNALDDQEFPFTAIHGEKMPPDEYEAGQKLFSPDYFDCAKCHIVGDRFPGGSPDSWAPDFALARARLKPEWIVKWILNPQDLLPGTKMPTFFDPEYFNESGPDDILEGDEHRQIRILRDYLLTLSGQPADTPILPAPTSLKTTP